MATPESMDPLAADGRSLGLPDISVWTQLDERLIPGSSTDGGRARRQHLRNPIDSCRPIGLQLIDEAGMPLSGWHQADILDISLGGLCLLMMEGSPLEFTRLINLRLDVRPHPSFGVDVVMAELRWFVCSGLITSLGLGFREQLVKLPSLLPCRRAERRPIDLDHTLV